MKSIKNSKFKNTGILYELLVRQVASDVLSNKDQSNAVSLIKKYFNPATELGKELNLYNSFSNANNLSEFKASKFIDVVIEKRKKLNNAEINKLKYNLIKEMKDLYDLNSMLKTKISSYKIYASLYKIFLYETYDKNSILEDVNELMDCRFTLMEQLMLTTKPSVKTKKIESKALMEYKQQDEDFRLYIFKVLIEKFNKKYSSLNENQKTLLRYYINDMSGNQLKNFINSEIPLLKKKLSAQLKTIDNKVLEIKLQEVVNQLNKLNIDGEVKDNQITSLLIAYEISKELER